MPFITRRDLLASSLVVSASSLTARSAFARTAALLATESTEPSVATLPAVGPREQFLFDFGWKFTFGNGCDPSKDLGFGFGQSDFSKTGEFDFAKAGFDDSAWRTLNLPHDWAVELPFVHDDSGGEDNAMKSHGYKPLGRRFPETSVGWYRREFDIPATDLGRRIWVEFDGAMRDVFVFVNGCFIGRNDNGYAPFRFDITDYIAYGAKNYIVLRVDASFGDGWFYEGAGVYRHVWLTKTDAVHLGKWDSVVRPTVNGDAATLALSTLVRNQGKQPATAKVSMQRAPPSPPPNRPSSPSPSTSRPLTPPPPAFPVPPFGRSMSPISTPPSSPSSPTVSHAMPNASASAFVRFSSTRKKDSSSTASPSGSRAPATTRIMPASALPSPTACRLTASASFRPWAATPYAPRTTCPPPSGSKPATAWAS
jgi:hypothetical protein